MTSTTVESPSYGSKASMLDTGEKSSVPRAEQHISPSSSFTAYLRGRFARAKRVAASGDGLFTIVALLSVDVVIVATVFALMVTASLVAFHLAGG